MNSCPCYANGSGRFPTNMQNHRRGRNEKSHILQLAPDSNAGLRRDVDHHRITGILLAIGIPFCIYRLDQSLRDPQFYVWTSRNVVKPNSHWRTTQETTDKGVNYE